MSNADLSKAPPWATHLVEGPGAFCFVNFENKRTTIPGTYRELKGSVSDASFSFLKKFKITELPSIEENE